MDTTLLKCVRGAGFRLRAAFRVEQKHRPLRFRLMSIFRIFSMVPIMPIFIGNEKRLYVHGKPRPNSKTGNMFQELEAAGVQMDRVFVDQTKSPFIVIKLVRLLLRLPAVFVILFRIRHRRRTDVVDLTIILAREIVRQKLRGLPYLHPLIVSDLSPSMHILWSAATAEGNRAIWWQDDFHHFKDIPYPLSAAAVLNLNGYLEVKKRSPNVKISLRKAQAPKPIPKIPLNPVLGVATNASFIGDLTQQQKIKSICKRLSAETVWLRLHPNSSLAEAEFSGTGIKICSRLESMQEFSRKIDLCLVGNSASMIWILLNGIPVLHCCGLDDNEYDLYGYVESGFVLGECDLDTLSIAAINDFYSLNNERYEKFKDYVTNANVPEERSLSDLAGIMK